MKLSEILNRYFVLPLNQSELVDFWTEDRPEHGEIIVITWADSDTLDRYRQEFIDQEVNLDLGDVIHFEGQFNVTPIGGDGPVTFIALDVVPLRPKSVANA